MEYLIKPDKATKLYDILWDIHLTTLTLGADRSRVSGHPIFTKSIAAIRTEVIYSLLNQSRAALIKQNIRVPRLDDEYSHPKQLRCIFNNLRTPSWLRTKIESAFQETNDCIHFDDPKNINPIIKNEESYKKTVRHISKLIQIVSNVPVLNKVKTIYDGGNFFPLTRERLHNTTENAANVKSERDKELDGSNVLLPIIFVLDQSISMNQDNRINELNKGFQWLNNALMNDEITKNSIEVNIITFSDKVREVLPFANLVRIQPYIKTLQVFAKGNQKKLGAAVTFALNNCENVKREYKNHDVEYHQPWLIIISDCEQQFIDNYEIAAKRAIKLQNPDNPKLNVIPIVVGKNDAEILRSFHIKNKVIRINEHANAFTGFFSWIKDNAAFFSRTPRDSKFTFTREQGWGVIE